MTLAAAELPTEFEEFRLLRPLGRGATGEVFLARDTALEREVAIKFLNPRQADGPGRDRFFSEARALARLIHPNIVAVHRIGEIRRRPYLVSEYVPGQPLDRLERPVPWDRLLAIALGLARGLGAAHRLGVLHRDVKPANAVLDGAGVVKLLDFGLAQTIDAEAVAGDGAGTPLYRAPELWQGLPATRQSDVYALGTVLYELAAGAAPFAGEPLAGLAEAVAGREAPSLTAAAPGIRAELAAIIHACLARDPAARPESGDALCDRLERIVEGGVAPAPAGNPYRGLSRFEAEHRALFFGRAAEVRAIVDQLRAQPFVLVAGDSGVGKSSLCRAGVVPAVLEGALGEATRWSALTLMPGRRPLAALAAALAPLLETSAAALEGRLGAEPDAVARDLGGRASGTLLVVDQLEELITVADDGVAAIRALAALAARTPRLRLLATLRSDFLSRAAALPGLGEQVSRALFLLGPLGARGLAEAIAGPAQAAGHGFDPPGVVELLAGQAAGRLPLLSFTLAELWDARDQPARLLTAAALDRLGGVEGALARHADAVLDALRPDERDAAWRVLTRLGGAAGTRAVLDRAGLAEIAGPAAGRVVERLIAARLLVASEDESGDARVDVVHEALFTAWPRLAAWRAADAEGERVQAELAAAARAWHGRGRPRHLLLQADDLAVAVRWRRRAAHAALTSVETAFLDASVAESRRGRRRRAAAVAAAFAVLTAAILVLVGANRETAAQRARAERATIVLLEEQGRRELLGGHAGQALAFLAAALQAGSDRPVLRFLLAEATRPFLARAGTFEGHGGEVAGSAWSPDGRRYVTSCLDGKLRLFDREGGAPLRVLDAGDVATWAAFSADSARVLGSTKGGQIKIWTVADGAPAGVLDNGRGAIHRFALAGGHLVTLAERGASLWDLETRARLADLAGVEAPAVSAALAPDASVMVTGHLDGTVAIYDRAGHLTASTEGHDGPVWGVELSPDGRRVSSSSEDGSARVWDLQARPIAALLGHTGAVYAASFSPDGKQLVTASVDYTAKIWDAETGRLTASLAGHAESVNDAAFAPDGRLVATGSGDGTVKLWDPAGGRARATFESGEARLVRFSPDGALVAVDGGDRATVWRVGRDQVLAELPHARRVFAAAFAPGGGRVATACADGVARVWDVARAAELVRVAPGAGELRAIAFSPDGTRLALGGADGVLRLVDAGSGVVLAAIPAHTGMLAAVAWSPDGGRLASVGADQRLRVFASDGSPRLTVAAAVPLKALAWSPDGRRIAIAGVGRSVLIHDTTTGALLVSTASRMHEVRGVSFSPDGRRLVSGDFAGARVWDAATGAQIFELVGHSADMIFAASFSPDGSRIATAAADRTARIWDAATGKQLAVRPARSYVVAVAWSDDGERLVTGSDDGATVWEAGLDRRSLPEVAGFVAAHPEIVRLMP